MTKENRKKMAQLFADGKAPEFECYAEEFKGELNYKPEPEKKSKSKGGKK